MHIARLCRIIYLARLLDRIRQMKLVQVQTGFGSPYLWDKTAGPFIPNFDNSNMREIIRPLHVDKNCGVNVPEFHKSFNEKVKSRYPV